MTASEQCRNAALGVVRAAFQQHGADLPQLVLALESAGLLQSPEAARERAVLVSKLGATRTVAEARAEEIVGLLNERHETNQCMSEAAERVGELTRELAGVAEAVRAKDERTAELEQQLAARTFYLAESEDAENGPTLHATHVAAIAWCDEVEPGDWFEDDGVWVQCNTDPDTDRPTTRGAGTVTPLSVTGDGIVAEADRLRREFLEKARKLSDLQQVREDEREYIRDLQKQQGAIMQALGCDAHDEWDDVMHRARQLAGGQAVSRG